MDDRMIQIYEMVADMTKSRVEKEKETILSEETYRMISLTQSLHNQIATTLPPIITAE